LWQKKKRRDGGDEQHAVYRQAIGSIAIRAIMGLVALTALGMDWTEELKTTQ